ncbi:TadE/TadG family type IV pilus assembly protein [Cupriavidus consociatus]|uniref:TadE/TadG family type IV pilus assembly protein n=1 Tax=Cupriavidus consociatus TaxID=2821357 RepID=UPI001AE581DA|nr:MULTISPECIES: TadE/TadG family type IV pilus assembly protein [unclassified Cupriavidus]MBP0622295.1 pilus assembly protein [Cupriavidus sp. LEh25]MDK2658972.1 TadE/TadG family type IV pilus assembly protein [Cupriavidus sp. LEh21]
MKPLAFPVPVRLRCRSRQRGSTIVEFGLIAGVFFTLLIGIAEFSRLLYYWNTAAEVTRLGARMAVVCDAGDAVVKNRMRELLPMLQNSNISVSYEPAGCDADAATARATCKSVAVSVTNVSVATVIPLVPLTVSMPPFTTSMTRESMQTSTGGTVCS